MGKNPITKYDILQICDEIRIPKVLANIVASYMITISDAFSFHNIPPCMIYISGKSSTQKIELEASIFTYLQLRHSLQECIYVSFPMIDCKELLDISSKQKGVIVVSFPDNFNFEKNKESVDLCKKFVQNKWYVILLVDSLVCTYPYCHQGSKAVFISRDLVDIAWMDPTSKKYKKGLYIGYQIKQWSDSFMAIERTNPSLESCLLNSQILTRYMKNLIPQK